MTAPPLFLPDIPPLFRALIIAPPLFRLDIPPLLLLPIPILGFNDGGARPDNLAEIANDGAFPRLAVPRLAVPPLPLPLLPVAPPNLPVR